MVLRLQGSQGEYLRCASTNNNFYFYKLQKGEQKSKYKYKQMAYIYMSSRKTKIALKILLNTSEILQTFESCV